MESNVNLLNDKLEIDSAVEDVLSETTKWAKFLAIIGFVVSGLIAILALFTKSLFNKTSGNNDFAEFSSGIAIMLSIIYLIGAVLGFVASMYMYKFANSTKQALAQQDQQSLVVGMTNLKSLFKFYGIIAIIYIGFLAIAFIFGGIGALTGR